MTANVAPVGSWKMNQNRAHSHNYQWTANSVQLVTGTVQMAMLYQQVATSSSGGAEAAPDHVRVAAAILI